MNKLELYTMLHEDDKRDELLLKVKELHKEAFGWGQGIKMQLFIDNSSGELFTTGNISTICIQGCTCLYSIDSHKNEDCLSEEIYNIARERHQEWSDLDDAELSFKLSYEEYQEIKEEAIVNLVEYCWDFGCEVSEILYELEKEVEYEEEIKREEEKYRDLYY
jgi:hypothetical protein